MQDYLKLFLIFLKIGAFTFGGGYAMLSIMQREFVDQKKLLTENDFLDIAAVAQSLPGPIAVNTSVFVGYKLRGRKGSLVALLGTVSPSLVIIIILATFYYRIKDIEMIQLFFKGVRPAIVALIFLAAIRLSKPIEKTKFNLSIFLLSLIGIVVFNIHPIYMIIISATVGYIYHNKEDKDGII